MAAAAPVWRCSGATDTKRHSAAVDARADGWSRRLSIVWCVCGGAGASVWVIFWGSEGAAHRHVRLGRVR